MIKYGQLKPDGYIPRIADKTLSELTGLFDAVEVTGTMWCGKTWTSLAFGASVAHLGTQAERILAEADPSTALTGRQPHVIDEWQDVPAIWDEVRHCVDEQAGGAGRFILTGSSRPKDEQVTHSGAGRIARMRMHTMSLAESGDSCRAVSLASLFSEKSDFSPVPIHQKLEPLAEIICRGGWPGLIERNISDTHRFLDGYFDAVFDVNIPRQKLNGAHARQVAMSLARNMGNAIRLATIANDAGFTEIDQKTATARVAAHIAALERLYVIEPLRGWDAPVRSKSRLRIKPKYYFADPSLAASLLQITPAKLLSDGNLFGILLEALCIHDLTVYAAAMPEAKSTPLAYYHDAEGLEADVILELRDGRWAAFEIKLGDNKLEEAAHSLNRLKKKIAANPAARNPKPEFTAVLVGAGAFARYDREHDLYVIPITALGP